MHDIRENPESFDFAIVNRREQQYHVEFTVRDDAGETVIHRVVDIAASPPSDGEHTVLNFDD